MNDLPKKLTPYRVEFPFSCQFSIPADDHNTTVTIETKSEALTYGTSVDDVRMQTEAEHQIDGPLQAKRILKFIRDETWAIDPREVSVTYSPDPVIEHASPETIEHFIQTAMDED